MKRFKVEWTAKARVRGTSFIDANSPEEVEDIFHQMHLGNDTEEIDYIEDEEIDYTEELDEEYEERD
jgi:hypothetical protein